MRVGLFHEADFPFRIHFCGFGNCVTPRRRGAAFHQRSVLIQIRTPPFFPRFAWVITAVGIVDEIPVMIVVVVAVAVMMIFSGVISDFIQRHPTLKMLALSFLLLIVVNLIGEGLGFHTSRSIAP